MTPWRFAHVLGAVESNNTPYGAFGDGGRAMGRWQLHPDALDTDKQLLGMSAQLGETWDSYVNRIVLAFYQHYAERGYNPQEVAMTWHLGHAIHEGDPGWDAAYNEKFLMASGRFAGAKRGLKKMTQLGDFWEGVILIAVGVALNTVGAYFKIDYSTTSALIIGYGVRHLSGDTPLPPAKLPVAA